MIMPLLFNCTLARELAHVHGNHACMPDSCRLPVLDTMAEQKKQGLQTGATSYHIQAEGHAFCAS